MIGYEGEILLDLKTSIGSIMHILRKLEVSTLDIFLSNNARSGKSNIQCYYVLELRRDGHATISRCSREIIWFWTPNVVVFFSNADPWKVAYLKGYGNEAILESES